MLGILLMTKGCAGNPDVFAIVTIDGRQKQSTSIVQNTLNPQWDQKFSLRVAPSSLLLIQVFDHKKRKYHKERLLGMAEFIIGDCIDIDSGASSKTRLIVPPS